MTSVKRPNLPGADFDHLTEEWASNPWPIWAKLRDEDSLAYSENHGGYYVASRYEDVCAITRDTATFSNFPGSAIPHLEMPPMPPVHYDPPEHTKYRRLINPYFAPTQVASLEPFVRDLVDKLVAPVLASSGFDVLSDVAEPLTRDVTFRLMGIEEQPDGIDKWVDDLLYKNEDTPASSQKLMEFMAAELQRRRAHPGEDVLSGLASAEIDGRPLSELELISASVLILSAGLETTNSAIGGGTLYMLQDAEVRNQLLGADDRTWRLAMDEIVRWVSPASANARHVKQDTEVHGCPLHKGDQVLVMWGSANRDEREFPDADAMVIDRFPNRHVGFGMGPHRCVGSHLAKLIMTAYFQRILPELGNWRLDGENAVRWGGAETRGIRSLKLARI